MALSQMFRAAHSSLSAAVSGEVRLALEAAEIPSFWRSFHEMQMELRRCRRYEHPLSILVVEVDSSRLQQTSPPQEHAGADGQALLRRFGCTAVLILGWILRDATRESDLLSYAAEHDLYVVVLPETNACGAHDAAVRLSHVYEQRSALGLKVGSATFPEHGFTLEGLFEEARTSLAPLPRVRAVRR